MSYCATDVNHTFQNVMLWARCTPQYALQWFRKVSTLVPVVRVTKVLPTLRWVNMLGAFTSYQSFLAKASWAFFFPPFFPLLIRLFLPTCRFIGQSSEGFRSCDQTSRTWKCAFLAMSLRRFRQQTKKALDADPAWLLLTALTTWSINSFSLHSFWVWNKGIPPWCLFCRQTWQKRPCVPIQKGRTQIQAACKSVGNVTMPDATLQHHYASRTTVVSWSIAGSVCQYFTTHSDPNPVVVLWSRMSLETKFVFRTSTRCTSPRPPNASSVMPMSYLSGDVMQILASNRP